MAKLNCTAKKILLSINIFFAVQIFTFADPYLNLAPDVSEEMLSADFWISKCDDPDKIQMSQEEIYIWNNQANKLVTLGTDPYRFLIDIRTYDRVLIGESIRSDIVRYNPSEVFYKKDSTGKAVKLDEDDYKSFYNLMNYAPLGSYDGDFKYKYSNGKLVAQSTNKKEFPLKKAVTVKRAELKLFPTTASLSKDKNYWYDDENQKSSLLMNEPVLVVWQSSDGKWLLVKSTYVTGWTRAENVAYVSDAEFNRYFDYTLPTHEAFVTITADRYTIPRTNFLDGRTDDIPELTMGTFIHIVKWSDKSLLGADTLERTPHGNYAAEIPYKKSDGTLGFRYAAIPYSVCTRGLVPFSQANILKLVFQTIGNPYGWGGQQGNRDCSALMLETFRCFGFIFGRNSLEQASLPGKLVDFHGTTDEETLELCKSLPAGTIMYFRGHVFMLIGFDNGKPYFISSAGAYLVDEDNKTNKINANSVIINNADLLRSSGKTWLSVLTYAKVLGCNEDNPVKKLNPEWEYADFTKINSGVSMLYRASSKRKNITVALNASHGTAGGEDFKIYYHPDKSEKINGNTEGFAMAEGMKFKNGNTEDDIVLRVAHLLKTELLSNGYDVLMIRDCHDVQLDSIARTLIGNHNADIQITIHYDSDGRSSDKGVFYCSTPETLKYLKNVAENYDESERLGKALVDGLKSKGASVFAGGSYESDNFQSCYSTIPCALIELGNQNSDTGFEALKTRARGLCDGINSFFGF